MAKWYGAIGYVDTVETKPGVFVERVLERNYYGDMLPVTRRLQTTDQVNDNIDIANELSIVADPYATEHIYSMRYAEFQGVRWKISNVKVVFPRLILTLGGLYNGEQT